MATRIFESEGVIQGEDGQTVATAKALTSWVQTYSTTNHTNSAVTAVAIGTTGSTTTTPAGYTTTTQADAIVTAVNALVVDVANVKQVIAAVVADLKSIGLAK